MSSSFELCARPCVLVPEEQGTIAECQHTHLGSLCVQTEALGLLVRTQRRAGTQPKHASRPKIWEAFWDNLIKTQLGSLGQDDSLQQDML